MLDSEKIPDVPKNIGTSEMADLFQNFTYNWGTLSPALWVLFGTLFGFFVLKLVKNNLTN